MPSSIVSGGLPLAKSSSAPALCTEGRTIKSDVPVRPASLRGVISGDAPAPMESSASSPTAIGQHISSAPTTPEVVLMKEAPKTSRVGCSVGICVAKPSIDASDHANAQSPGASAAKMTMPTLREALDSTAKSISAEVTPTGVAIELDSFSFEEVEPEPETEMGETVSPGAAIIPDKPCLVPAFPAFAPGAMSPKAACLRSPQSNQASPPSSVASRVPSSRSLQSPCLRLHGDSPQVCVAAGPTGVRQRSKAYVAKAQECWSRWRRERSDARAADVKAQAASVVKQPLAEHCSGAPGLENILEVRGVAPSPKPASKRAGARGSLAAARALYAPPPRRAAKAAQRV